MELPHGVLIRSFKGPLPLSELNIALQKDSFTGFMRASLFRGAFAEGSAGPLRGRGRLQRCARAGNLATEPESNSSASSPVFLKSRL